MSQEIFEKYFPVGATAAVFDPVEGKGYTFKILEYSEMGIFGVDKDEDNIFIPWNSGLLLMKRKPKEDCDCAVCSARRALISGSLSETEISSIEETLDSEGTKAAKTKIAKTLLEGLLQKLSGEQKLSGQKDSEAEDPGPPTDSRWRPRER